MWQGMQYLCSVRSVPSLTFSMLVYIFKNAVTLMQSARLVRISSVVVLYFWWPLATFGSALRFRLVGGISHFHLPGDRMLLRNDNTARKYARTLGEPLLKPQI